MAISSAHAVTITVGSVGSTAGVNNWPFEAIPENAIDGLVPGYLNFGEFNTGIVVTMSSGPRIATSMQVWTNNSSEDRDPASYQIFGTNSVIAGPSFDSSLFTLVSSGGLSLPALREFSEPLNANDTSTTVNFANSDSYASYMILFPTVKNEATADRMHVGEIQLFDTNALGVFDPTDSVLGVQAAETIPEPTTSLLALTGALVMLRRRR